MASTTDDSPRQGESLDVGSDLHATNTELRDVFTPGGLINRRYRIVRRLGGGGNGTVYQANDLLNDTGDDIAIKVLATHDLEGDPTLLQRFINEVSLVKTLNHPNIIEVFDMAKTPLGQHYLTMEYVSGGTLRDHISAASLSFEEVLRILHDIAAALSYAHSKSVVHRDLKPENILLSPTNEVKIVDFGLARNMNHGFTMTPAGETVGTPYYMSPEQLKGQRVDGRTDIYALGIMAFELVTGVRPFREGDLTESKIPDLNENLDPKLMEYYELAQKHLYDPLPPLENTTMPTPSWFELFIRSCTKKEPERRYPSMEHVVRVLEQRMRKLGLLGDRSVEEKLISRVVSRIFGLD